MSAGVSQPTRNMHPNSLAAITPHRLKPGDEWRGNPGGHPKGAPRVDVAYARLGKLPIDELRAYEPTHAIEFAVKSAILRACEAPDWQAAHAALKELADRLDGKPEQRKVVEHTGSVEVRQQVVIEAYVKVFDGRTFEQDVEQLRAIHFAPDEQARRLAIAAAIESDAEAVAGVWLEAEKAVTGESR